MPRQTPWGPPRLSLRKKRLRNANSNETNVHGDSLCFKVKAWARHNTTEQDRIGLNNGWRLAAVGGWRLAAIGGGWRLGVGGPLGLSFRAVLQKIMKDTPGVHGRPAQ